MSTPSHKPSKSSPSMGDAASSIVSESSSVDVSDGGRLSKKSSPGSTPGSKKETTNAKEVRISLAEERGFIIIFHLSLPSKLLCVPSILITRKHLLNALLSFLIHSTKRA